MKNIKLIIAALASFAALSCEKESLPQSNSETDLVPLVLTTGDDTKTSLQTDGSIHWSNGDQISVIDNGVGHIGEKNIHSFSISNIRGSKATFSGNVRRTTSQICAVYPAGLVVSGDVGGLTGLGSNRDITVRIPSKQTAKIGTFNDNLNISVAKTPVSLSADNTLPSDLSVTFKNVCALLSFTMPSTLPGEITSVTIASSVAIAGNMNIDYSGNTPKVESLSNPVKQITMVGDFEAGKTYWFVLAPVTLKGISIDVETESGVYTKANSSDIALSQGKYRSLGTLNFDKMKPITVSSEHVYGNNTLLGTNLSVNLPYANVSAVNLTVKLGDKVVRTITDTKDVVNGVAKTNYDAAGNWPYLPYGNYNISGYYTTGFGKVNVDYSFSIAERPANLSVSSVNAYTSYTKYCTSGADSANACDGTSIYLNQISGISGDILKQSHYSPYLKAKFDSGDEISPTYIESEESEYRFSMPAYGQYKTVVLSFDGTTSSSSATLSDCHVTGLPYTLNPANNDSVNPWGVASTNDILYVSWTGSALKVGGNSVGANVGAIKSFYVPEKTQINVTASASGSVTGGRFNANTGSVKLGGKELVSSTAEKGGLFSGTKTVTFSKTDSESMSISTSNSQLSCSVTYGLSDAHMLVNSLMISYR